ncbi:hypothetical protein LTR85_001151 [Meristemomyces frigidus]|nr:hypothetical protein LTR85_001151 [Meristemomyces frigidus]
MHALSSIEDQVPGTESAGGSDAMHALPTVQNQIPGTHPAGGSDANVEPLFDPSNMQLPQQAGQGAQLFGAANANAGEPPHDFLQHPEFSDEEDAPFKQEPDANRALEQRIEKGKGKAPASVQTQAGDEEGVEHEQSGALDTTPPLKEKKGKGRKNKAADASAAADDAEEGFLNLPAGNEIIQDGEAIKLPLVKFDMLGKDSKASAY